MGGVCAKSDKEHELTLEPTIEKSGKVKSDLEAEFLNTLLNIRYTNSSVKVIFS